MKASFVIGFHTRRFDNLLQTLRFLSRDHRSLIQDCQLVTLCQDVVSEEQLSNTDLPTLNPQESATAQFEQISSKFGQWVHYDLEEPYMKLPKITNFGIEKTICDKIVVLESDRILPAGYFDSMLSELKEGKQITTREMIKLKRPTLDIEIQQNIHYDYVNERRSPKNKVGQRNMWSGNTAFMKSDFYKAGGMDEEYVGYGWADSDMTFQMESVGVESIFREETEIHLWHESMTYGTGNQKKMFLENGKRFVRKWNVEEPQWFKEEVELYCPEVRIG